MNTPLAQFRVDSLEVVVHEDRAQVGRAAALRVAEAIKQRQAQAATGNANVIFAAAPARTNSSPA